MVRDFQFSTEEATKQQQDLELAGTTEKELWVSVQSHLLFHLVHY